MAPVPLVREYVTLAVLSGSVSEYVSGETVIESEADGSIVHALPFHEYPLEQEY